MLKEVSEGGGGDGVCVCVCLEGWGRLLDKKNVENCLVYLSFGVSTIAAKSSPIH